MEQAQILQMVTRKKIDKDELDHWWPNFRIYIGVPAALILFVQLGFQFNTFWAYLVFGLLSFLLLLLIYFRLNDRDLLTVETNKSKEENHAFIMSFGVQKEWSRNTNHSDWAIFRSEGNWGKCEKIVMIPMDGKIYLNLRTFNNAEKALFSLDRKKQKQLAKELFLFTIE
jgi:hypothetical protein